MTISKILATSAFAAIVSAGVAVGDADAGQKKHHGHEPKPAGTNVDTNVGVGVDTNVVNKLENHLTNTTTVKQQQDQNQKQDQNQDQSQYIKDSGNSQSTSGATANNGGQTMNFKSTYKAAASGSSIVVSADATCAGGFSMTASIVQATGGVGESGPVRWCWDGLNAKDYVKLGYENFDEKMRAFGLALAANASPNAKKSLVGVGRAANECGRTADAFDLAVKAIEPSYDCRPREVVRERHVERPRKKVKPVVVAAKKDVDICANAKKQQTEAARNVAKLCPR